MRGLRYEKEEINDDDDDEFKASYYNTKYFHEYKNDIREINKVVLAYTFGPSWVTQLVLIS